MKATATMPATRRNQVTLRNAAEQVTNLLRRAALPGAVAGTTGAWICALAAPPIACGLCALLVTVCAAVNYSDKKGGKI